MAGWLFLPPHGVTNGYFERNSVDDRKRLKGPIVSIVSGNTLWSPEGRPPECLPSARDKHHPAKKHDVSRADLGFEMVCSSGNGGQVPFRGHIAQYKKSPIPAQVLKLDG
jgi:hypothetical protein